MELPQTLSLFFESKKKKNSDFLGSLSRSNIFSLFLSLEIQILFLIFFSPYRIYGPLNGFNVIDFMVGGKKRKINVFQRMPTTRVAEPLTRGCGAIDPNWWVRQSFCYIYIYIRLIANIHVRIWYNTNS